MVSYQKRTLCWIRVPFTTPPSTIARFATDFCVIFFLSSIKLFDKFSEIVARHSGIVKFRRLNRKKWSLMNFFLGRMTRQNETLVFFSSSCFKSWKLMTKKWINLRCAAISTLNERKRTARIEWIWAVVVWIWLITRIRIVGDSINQFFFDASFDVSIQIARDYHEMLCELFVCCCAVFESW